MKLTEELKKKIDNMDYESMLTKWRYASLVDVMFTNPSGEYFSNRMFELRDKLPRGEHTRISKKIGWCSE